MGIIVNLDVVMAKRKIGSGELAEKIGITQNRKGKGCALFYPRKAVQDP